MSARPYGVKTSLHGRRVGLSGRGYLVVDDIPASALPLTLTDAATIVWDAERGNIGALTLGGNRTMAAPINLRPGTYILHVIQDGIGSRTITWNAAFKWSGGVAPVLTTTAGARDVLSFVSDGTNLYGAVLQDVR